jgi:hypothetical protein
VLSEAVSEAEVESGPIYRRAKIDTSSVGNEQVYGRRIIRIKRIRKQQSSVDDAQKAMS